MKFTTSTITALSFIVYQANNIVIAHDQISCTSIYEPVRCGNNKQDWFSNDCLAIQGGYKNPDKDCHEVVQDDCNQLTDIISLMEEKFGQENCDEFSAFPESFTVTCTIKEGTGRGTITAKLNAPYNEDDIAAPGDITLGSGGGIVGNQPIVEFSNDCTGNDLMNVQDLLKDIERPPQDDCNQLTDIISLMEETFGQENCEEFSAFPQGLTVTCSIEVGSGSGTITAKLNAPYNEDHIAAPGDITLGSGGGIVGIQPVVEFSNGCTGDDLQNVQDLLKDIERPPQDECNQLTEIRSLMEEKFGQENCDEFSAFTKGLLTVTCTIKEGTGGGTITAKLNAPYNEDAIATPSDITLVYGGGVVGIQPVVEFSNDCTGDDLQNVHDLLEDINNDTDDIVLCPAVYEPVACGENFADTIFSNQCKANIAQFDTDQCTCYEKDDIMFLMEEKMGVHNCAYNTDSAFDQDSFLYECENAMGQTASLYSNDIEMPESLFFAATGGSNTDVVLFENDCHDLTETVAFFANNGM